MRFQSGIEHSGMKRLVAFTIAAVLAAVAAFVALSLFATPSVPAWFSAVSAGNGYDALLQAGEKIKGKPPEGKADVEAFVNENEGVIAEIRTGLKLPFEVPLASYSATNNLVGDYGRFKTIARTLQAGGKAAENREAFREAAGIYTEVIQLGQRAEHGPIIALLTGVVIERIGLEALEKIAPRLSQAERKQFAEQLESLNKERLPLSEIARRERFYMNRMGGNPIKLLVARIHLRKSMKTRMQREQQLSSDFTRVAENLRNDAIAQ